MATDADADAAVLLLNCGKMCMHPPSSMSMTAVPLMCCRAADVLPK
jgi:hypothetical protein